jgi:hypothetical protein
MADPIILGAIAAAIVPAVVLFAVRRFRAQKPQADWAERKRSRFPIGGDATSPSVENRASTGAPRAGEYHG